MARSPDLSTEWIKKKLAQIALKVEKGEIDTKRANCMSGIWSKCLYAIQIQNKEEDTELAKRTLEKLETIEDALNTGNRAKLMDLQEGID